MKKRTVEEIRFLADKHYVNWIACYGLKDALRVCTELKRKLMKEKKRRREDGHKDTKKNE